MKKDLLQNLAFACLGLFIYICSSQSIHGQTNSTAKRVIILGIDGFSVPGFKEAKHPNLDLLLKNGVLSLDTRAVMPSVTLPNWTSHLSGSGPEQHGVDNNSWEKNTASLPPVTADEDGYYPTVFKLLKDKYPNAKTAYYYNWGNLIKPINRRYLGEVNFLDNYEYHENYENASRFAKDNRNNPTLIFLYTVHTDHAGHDFKWMSKEYITALEEADLAIGKLVSELKSEGLYDETNFFLITDHGGNEKGHGGMSAVEMTVPWAVTGPGIQKGKILAEPNNNTNTANVICRLFGITAIPKAWIGEVPKSFFESN